MKTYNIIKGIFAATVLSVVFPDARKMQWIESTRTTAIRKA